MKSLYNAGDTAEIQQRIARLTPDREPLWGKMNVGQAMAHCVVGLESARCRASGRSEPACQAA